VLFGLEIVFGHQHRRRSLPGGSAFSLNVTAREELAVALLLQVNLHFLKGGIPPSPHLLADELNVPLLPLETLFDQLERLGFLAETSGNRSGWLPARDPSELQVSDVIAALRGVSELQAETPVLRVAEEVVQKGWDGSRAFLEGVTIRELLLKMENQSGDSRQ
jgi:membrane protein